MNESTAVDSRKMDEFHGLERLTMVSEAIDVPVYILSSSLLQQALYSASQARRRSQRASIYRPALRASVTSLLTVPGASHSSQGDAASLVNSAGDNTSSSNEDDTQECLRASQTGLAASPDISGQLRPPHLDSSPDQPQYPHPPNGKGMEARGQAQEGSRSFLVWAATRSAAFPTSREVVASPQHVAEEAPGDLSVPAAQSTPASGASCEGHKAAHEDARAVVVVGENAGTAAQEGSQKPAQVDAGQPVQGVAGKPTWGDSAEATQCRKPAAAPQPQPTASSTPGREAAAAKGASSKGPTKESGALLRQVAAASSQPIANASYQRGPSAPTLSMGPADHTDTTTGIGIPTRAVPATAESSPGGCSATRPAGATQDSARMSAAARVEAKEPQAPAAAAAAATSRAAASASAAGLGTAAAPNLGTAAAPNPTAMTTTMKGMTATVDVPGSGRPSTGPAAVRAAQAPKDAANGGDTVHGILHDDDDDDGSTLSDERWARLVAAAGRAVVTVGLCEKSKLPSANGLQLDAGANSLRARLERNWAEEQQREARTAVQELRGALWDLPARRVACQLSAAAATATAGGGVGGAGGCRRAAGEANAAERSLLDGVLPGGGGDVRLASRAVALLSAHVFMALPDRYSPKGRGVAEEVGLGDPGGHHHCCAMVLMDALLSYCRLSPVSYPELMALARGLLHMRLHPLPGKDTNFASSLPGAVPERMASLSLMVRLVRAAVELLINCAPRALACSAEDARRDAVARDSRGTANAHKAVPDGWRGPKQQQQQQPEGGRGPEAEAEAGQRQEEEPTAFAAGALAREPWVTRSGDEVSGLLEEVVWKAVANHTEAVYVAGRRQTNERGGEAFRALYTAELKATVKRLPSEGPRAVVPKGGGRAAQGSGRPCDSDGYVRHLLGSSHGLASWSAEKPKQQQQPDSELTLGYGIAAVEGRTSGGGGGGVGLRADGSLLGARRLALARVMLDAALEGRRKCIIAEHPAALQHVVTLASVVGAMRQAAQPHPAAAPPDSLPSDGLILLRFEVEERDTHSSPTNCANSNANCADPKGTPGSTTQQAKGGAGSAGSKVGQRPCQPEVSVAPGAGREERLLSGKSNEPEGCGVGVLKEVEHPVRVTLVPCPASAAEQVRERRLRALEACRGGERGGFLISVPPKGYLKAAGDDDVTFQSPNDNPIFVAHCRELRDGVTELGCVQLVCKGRLALQGAALLVSQVQAGLPQGHTESPGGPAAGARPQAPSAPAAASGGKAWRKGNAAGPPAPDPVPTAAAAGTADAAGGGAEGVPLDVLSCADAKRWDPELRDAVGRVLGALPTRGSRHRRGMVGLGSGAGAATSVACPGSRRGPVLLDGWQVARRVALNREVCRLLGLVGYAGVLSWTGEDEAPRKGCDEAGGATTGAASAAAGQRQVTSSPLSLALAEDDQTVLLVTRELGF